MSVTYTRVHASISAERFSGFSVFNGVRLLVHDILGPFAVPSGGTTTPLHPIHLRATLLYIQLQLGLTHDGAFRATNMDRTF
jgi:hypothetical protein